jgi:Na+/phosphate symporter
MGFVLLISGWALVLAALVLLTGVGQRFAFILAGIAVETLGLHLMGSAYKALQSMPKKSGAPR